MLVPFIDLKAQHQRIKTEIDAAISAVFEEGQFIGGHWVEDFERDFSSYLGVKHCIACANGTDSLEMALQVLGIGPRDEVIVPATSWISTSSCVSSVGARVVFADVDAKFFTINPEEIRKKITAKTKAIIPVHLYGMPADMPAIMQIAKEFNLKVIEDCAQSVGAHIHGKMTGTFGDIASFSFYPTKNLGAYGDAGALVTNNVQLADDIRMLANHGQKHRDEHLSEGRNSRMDSLQAAILSAKLPFLNEWNQRRIAHAKIYNELLPEELNLPKALSDFRHVYHIYAIHVQKRSLLVEKLLKAGIQTGIHFPNALPFLAPYQKSNHSEKDFPVAAHHSETTLSLPIYPELSEAQIRYVAEAVIKSL